MDFALDKQIASQADAIRSLIARIDIPILDSERPFIFSGIGTSLHACRVAAYWLYELSAGKIRASVLNAHELALSAPISSQDQVIVISHRGTKRFPRQALTRARQAGALTIAITCLDAPAQDADYTIHTCSNELAGTHTVSYTTALTALAHLVASVTGEAGHRFLTAIHSVPEAIETTLAEPAPSAIAEKLVDREPILLAGMGLDAITVAEAALKIKEGTYQWAEGIELENALHGPPAAIRAGVGAIVMVPDWEDGGRAQLLIASLKDLGAEVYTCGSGQEDLRFTAVERLIRPLVSIIPLQRLTAEIARIRHTNPDEIHRDVEPWNTVMGNIVL
ncbi:SIS domain-containing protein [Dictyobacter kobayashii]|uniref:Glutamine--fructose-6-phosphate aminotransferase [isomerizing] n=1 Tax=Dictyobacter kobayashii TaxID=2014872 RepID=A0A402ABC9_9CHLR|nr:SIS domain-containing protein [Dictyobacter kobayashii]GCE16325.1 hypothetical protein KDK_01250 [Dictyobacter kobayashii]